MCLGSLEVVALRECALVGGVLCRLGPVTRDDVCFRIDLGVPPEISPFDNLTYHF